MLRRTRFLPLTILSSRHCAQATVTCHGRALSTAQTGLLNPLRLPDDQDVHHPVYNYTSGRWLYNERLRRAERHLVFNVTALLRVTAESVNKPLDMIVDFKKIAEGGSFRVFETVFSDGFAAITRLPYPCTIPRSFGIASEVATIQYLHLQGIPVPRLFGWATSAANPVGSEYMIMAKVQGQDLEQSWYDMTFQDRISMMEKIVHVEKKLFNIRLPASGSIYHRSFLESQGISGAVILDTGSDADEFCIGPSVELLWWYNQRDELSVNRGPWTSTVDVLKSVGERELAWLDRFAKPRYPRDPLYRAFYDHKKVDPQVQKQVLQDYLGVIAHMIPEQAELNQPTLRHPDLSPSNIIVSESGEITGLIDWQHTSILPLYLQAKIPKHFQNWGDEDSENLRRPKLPENFNDLTASEQEAEEEKYRKRQMHYYYVGYTRRDNNPHFLAISKPHLVTASKLFDVAARPWEGDNTSLKAEMIKTAKHWPVMASTIQYTREEITQCLAIDQQQQEADAQMHVLRDCFNTNIDGWVSLELYDVSKARENDVRKQMVEAAENQDERKEVEENWPFQDHVEID